MRIAVVISDLMLFSRIDAAAAAAGASLTRLDSPLALPAPDAVDLVLVDWAAHEGDWGSHLVAWRAAGSRRPRVVVFGRHTDLDAHRDVRAAGLGPMWARSKLVAVLPGLFENSLAGEARDDPSLAVLR